MRIQLKTGREVLFADKPAGLPTHANERGLTGFVEWLEQRLGQKLWVVHRLDKTTTGAIAFATSAARAEELRVQFENREVKKTYWFVTDRASQDGELAIETRIEKRGSSFVSERSGEPPNSKTVFKRVKRSPFFELWQAHPESGRPHQIRLHARDLGLPILGDTLYGGTAFPHLCLHALSLQLPDEPEWTTPAPRFFERLGVARDLELVSILAALDRRQRLFGFLAQPKECLRLIHGDLPDFRLDLFGPVLWLNWYRDQVPQERDFERWDFVRTLLRRPLLIQKRQDRGADPNSQSLWPMGEVLEKWTAEENGLRFEFRREQGLSGGLFLDQRLNRERLAKESPGKSVLNLFAYTAGFSLAAAKAGASQVTTVDLSKSFIQWGQENFRLNGLEPEKYEWSAADTFVFLKGAAKRDRKWDFIVCDPPSFSRKDKQVFRLKEDLEDLLKACAACLAPKGVLLFSCNIESLTRPQLEQRIKKVFPKAQISQGAQDPDYELPNQEADLKSFWIHL